MPSFSINWQMLRGYKDRRLGMIFVLGIASGFPWVLIGSAMAGWLKDLDVSRSTIGFVGAVGGVYALNFLWAPLLDRYRPWLTSHLGQRRSWIVAMQIMLGLTTLVLSRIDPSQDFLITGMLLVTIAFFSATQDAAIDAFRVEIIGRDEQELISYGAAMATSGWWTGYGLLGAVPFLLVDRLPGGWSTAYAIMAAVWILFVLFVLLLPEPHRIKTAGRVAMGILEELKLTVLEPLKEFFVRNGVRLAITILAFVLLFKIGEAFLGRMSVVFYREVGFSNADIGLYSKLVNWWVTVLFAIIGSFINAHFGILRGLVIGGLAMASTNLMFSWLAVAGPEPWLLVLAVIVDGFTAAMGTVAFIAFVTFLTSRTFTATQYALMTSIGNLGRTTLGSSGGWVVDQLGGNWALFFVLTALAVIPSLLLLYRLVPQLERLYPGALRSRAEQDALKRSNSN